MEAKLQKTIITWLKKKGCYVMKMQSAPGIPVGCPDIIALVDGGGWVALEVKATEKSRLQPLQKDTIYKLDNMYFARIVHPDNWSEVKAELETML